MKKVTVALGLQFGDEGKGKIIDWLSEYYDYVARFNGGANAGHTVSFDGKTFKLNLIPSGIFNPRAYNFLCAGMVIDLEKVIEEMADLQKKNISVLNLRISARAHIVMPWHKIIDAAKDAARGDLAIGTTGRGIGPCYADKASRIGIRIGELLDIKRLTESVERCYKLKEREISLFENAKLPPLAQIIDDFKKHAHNLSSCVADTEELLRRALKDGKKILLEGAQGAMIDLDNGTYPFVTSSSATSAGACVGAGLPPTAINEIIGIAKAYITRVGNGPLVTELNDEIGETLRKNGNEFGTTTGRPRRCGWFDVPLVRHTAGLNGVTGIILTKLDVLTGISPIKVATEYRAGRTTNLYEPSPLYPLEECRPFYEEFEGWKEPIANVNSWNALPPQAQRHVEELEKLIGFPIIAVATGSDRKAIIKR